MSSHPGVPQSTYTFGLGLPSTGSALWVRGFARLWELVRRLLTGTIFALRPWRPGGPLTSR